MRQRLLREYDPQIGHFMSADPYVSMPSAAQSHNRFLT